MAESAANQLLIAYVEALKGNAALDIIVTRRVFNYIPRNTQYPYSVIHITDSNEWDTDSDNGEEHSVYVHAWDDKEGSKRVNDILRAVFEQLHDDTTYSLTDHNLVNCRRVSQNVVRDGQLFHGTAIYRAVTEEA